MTVLGGCHVPPFLAYFGKKTIKTGLRDSPNLRSENDINENDIYCKNRGT